MAFGVEILQKYVSTCAACDNNRNSLCGFINASNRCDKEPSIADCEGMSHEEMDLLNTRIHGLPCNQQLSHCQLVNKIENELEDYSIAPSDHEIKIIISQCYKLVEKARRIDSSIEGVFDKSVRDAVNVILSYLDLRSLEAKRDINDLLLLYPYGYNREAGVYKYCLPLIVEDYLRSINSKDPYTGSVNQHDENMDLQISKNSFQKEFLELFTGREATDYIDALLIMNDFSFAMPYWESYDELGLFICCSLESCDLFLFNKWDEFRKEISRTIKRFTDDHEKLKAYIASFLRPVSHIKNYFSPKNEELEYILAAKYLELLTYTRVDSIDIFSTIWKESLAEVKRCKAKRHMTQRDFVDHVSLLVEQKSEPYIAENGCRESWGLFNLRLMLSKLVYTIEGCLLENNIEYDILDFQEELKLHIVDRVTDFQIAMAMEWSLRTFCYYQCTAGHKIEEASKEEIYKELHSGNIFIQKDLNAIYTVGADDSNNNISNIVVENDVNDQSPIKQNIQNIASNYEIDVNGETSSTLEDLRSIYPMFFEYLGALQLGGFLDDKYEWIKKGHTNYHAGWAAKIIISHVHGMTY